MEMGGSFHAPAALILEMNSACALTRRLGGHNVRPKVSEEKRQAAMRCRRPALEQTVVKKRQQ
jgi:hypothetical protein